VKHVAQAAQILAQDDGILSIGSAGAQVLLADVVGVLLT
jgi:hypothetical protein